MSRIKDKMFFLLVQIGQNRRNENTMDNKLNFTIVHLNLSNSLQLRTDLEEERTICYHGDGSRNFRGGDTKAKCGESPYFKSFVYFMQRILNAFFGSLELPFNDCTETMM